MPPSIPCTSDDGNEAVIIVSNIMPGANVPTQSLCLQCAPAFFAALLEEFTGVDVTDWLYSQADSVTATTIAEGVTADGDGQAPDPPPAAAATSGRSRGKSRAAGTDAGRNGEASETSPADPTLQP